MFYQQCNKSRPESYTLIWKNKRRAKKSSLNCNATTKLKKGHYMYKDFREDN